MSKNKVQSIRGMYDVGPNEIDLWHLVESKIHKVCTSFGYFEVRTPILENTALFKRGVGDTTDIVEKEMYTFQDRNGDSLSLRPEGTASVVRAVIENNWMAESPVLKMYYIGPMFRHERPQKGRYRQFYQYGFELLGSSSPQADVEIIALQNRLMQELNLKGVELNLSSVGCEVCRPPYRDLLLQYLQKYQTELCEDCQRRMLTNPLRVLDCKVEKCKKIAEGAPVLLDHLCANCDSHFSQVRAGLQNLNIPFRINPRIVRGLDYYVRTAFEFINIDQTLGAQSTVGGGGRYDKLIEQLGGAETSAVGFAAGMERLLMLLQTQNAAPTKSVDVFCVAADESVRGKMYLIAYQLREKSLTVEIDLEHKSMKAQLKRANKVNAKFSLILGEQELQTSNVLLKNMQTQTQETLQLGQVVAEIFKRLNYNFNEV